MGNGLKKLNSLAATAGKAVELAGYAKAAIAPAEATPVVARGETPASPKAVVEALGQLDGIPLADYFFETDCENDPDWRVRSIELHEGISEVYKCILDLATDDLDTNLEALGGASCVFRIERGLLVRRVCGIVTRVEYRGSMPGDLLVRVHVKPALAALAQTRNSRIFQNQSVKEILSAVLTPGLAPYGRKIQMSLTREYKPREYTTQYNESDLDFAQRLMAEEGIFFYFDHSKEEEELVLVDANQRCPKYESADGEPIPIVNAEAPQHLFHVETMRRFFFGREMQPTSVVVRDFDWTDPDRDLTCPASGNPADAKGREREVYCYPSPQVIAGYDSATKKYGREEGKIHQKLWMEEVTCRDQGANGQSNVTGLCPGLVVELGGNLPPGLRPKHLLTHVDHEGEAAEEMHFQMHDVKGKRERYENRFTCVPLDVPFRPEPVSRPAVLGPQTATVVGPRTEEVFTDEHGRIKVQFHWDRKGKRDDHSSCWVRVSQIWGGAGWGFVFIPRVGMEVVVHFLEGNPDRPLVTGCVYNGTHTLPYDLPAHKTRSTIKTASSPGNGGSNELSFEDAAGMEKLYLHAQRDLNEVVKHDHTTTVRGQRTSRVEKTRTVTVGEDQLVKVTGNQTVVIEGKGKGEIQSAVSVTGSHFVEASESIQLKAEKTLTLVCGKSWIQIEPGRISLQAGDGAALVLDDKGAMGAQAGGRVVVDADAYLQAIPGNKVLIDANAPPPELGDIT